MFMKLLKAMFVLAFITISGLKAENWAESMKTDTYKEFCRQLEAKKAAGELTEEHYAQAKLECARSLGI